MCVALANASATQPLPPPAKAPRGMALLRKWVPTSSVIRSFPAWPFRNILFAHEAIRRDCLIMLDMLHPDVFAKDGVVPDWKVCREPGPAVRL